MRKKFLIGGVLALAAASSPALASTSSVSVASLPQGMVVISAGPVGTTSYISLPLSNSATYTGVVTAVGSNTINVASSTSPFTTNLATAGSPYFVKVLTGSEEGRTLLITGNTPNSLTVSISDDSAQQVSLLTTGFTLKAGDTFEVLPGDTLSSIFGANTHANPLSFTGSTSFTTADWVNIFNPSTGSWQICFFNTTLGFWTVEGTTTNANNTVLYPYTGLSLTRHSATEPTPLSRSHRAGGAGAGDHEDSRKQRHHLRLDRLPGGPETLAA